MAGSGSSRGSPSDFPVTRDLYYYGAPEVGHLLPEHVAKAVVAAFEQNRGAIKLNRARSPQAIERTLQERSNSPAPLSGRRRHSILPEIEIKVTDAEGHEGVRHFEQFPGSDALKALQDSVLRLPISERNEADNLFVLYEGRSRIDPSVSSVLGEGGFGRVKVAQNIANGQWYAIKIIDELSFLEKNGITDKDSPEGRAKLQELHALIDNERDALQAQGFYHAELQRNDKYYLLQELIPGKSMVKTMESSAQMATHADAVVDRALFQNASMARGVVKNLLALHAKDIIHLDLSANNVLCDKIGLSSTIIDFGMSKKKGEQDLRDASPEYTHPTLLGLVNADGFDVASVTHDYYALATMFIHDLSVIDMVDQLTTPADENTPSIFEESTREYVAQYIGKLMGSEDPRLTLEVLQEQQDKTLKLLQKALSSTGEEKARVVERARRHMQMLHESYGYFDPAVMPTPAEHERMMAILQDVAEVYAYSWMPYNEELRLLGLTPEDISRFQTRYDIVRDASDDFFNENFEAIRARTSQALAYTASQLDTADADGIPDEAYEEILALSEITQNSDAIAVLREHNVDMVGQAGFFARELLNHNMAGIHELVRGRMTINVQNQEEHAIITSAIDELNDLPSGSTIMSIVEILMDKQLDLSEQDQSSGVGYTFVTNLLNEMRRGIDSQPNLSSPEAVLAADSSTSLVLPSFTQRTPAERQDAVQEGEAERSEVKPAGPSKKK